MNGLFEIRGGGECSYSGIIPFNGYAPFLNIKDGSNISMLQLTGTNSNGFYIRGKQAGNVTLSGTAWCRILVNNQPNTFDNSVTFMNNNTIGNSNITIKADTNSDSNLRSSICFLNNGWNSSVVYLDTDRLFKYKEHDGNTGCILSSRNFSVNGTTLTIII